MDGKVRSAVFFFSENLITDLEHQHVLFPDFLTLWNKVTDFSSLGFRELVFVDGFTEAIQMILTKQVYERLHRI